MTVADDVAPGISTDVRGCNGSVISGPYYTRELAGPPWGTDAVVSVDGRVLQKLAWPTDGTVALFGRRAV
ncbi:hypothetical protein [Intrasporangium flavum]|uniref:hypothetical protein n=1 Tax=Intrasporangium flavum TaxID=1428657 RepID=UPI001A9772E0|nr:hypothetical protein [Intrasporangium flavum]